MQYLYQTDIFTKLAFLLIFKNMVLFYDGIK